MYTQEQRDTILNRAYTESGKNKQVAEEYLFMCAVQKIPYDKAIKDVYSDPYVTAEKNKSQLMTVLAYGILFCIVIAAGFYR